MRTLLLTLFLLCGLAAKAQAPFLKLYHDQDTLFWSTNIVLEAANGDVVEVCGLYEADPDTIYLVFRRSDPDGVLLIATRIKVPAPFFFEPSAILELPDGSFLLFGTAVPQAMVVHLDAQGTLLSAGRYNGTATCYRSAFWENDSTILAMGADLISNTDTRMLLSRFNTAGEHLGSQEYTIDGYGATGCHGMRCAAGGVLIAAYGADSISLPGSNSMRTCLLRLDDAGNVLWARRYIRPAHLFFPTAFVENADGSILVGGATWGSDEPSRCYAMHLDPQGDTLATRIFQEPLTPDFGFGTSGFAAITDTSVAFTGFLSEGSYILTCDRAGMPLALRRFTATRFINTAVRSVFGDLLMPVACPPPNVSGWALGVWRTPGSFLLPCAEPLTVASFAPILLLGQGHVQEPVSMEFDDITAQCPQSSSVMNVLEPCLSTHAALPYPPVEELRIWPVPASEHLTVSTPDMERIDILDACGRVVMSQRAHAASVMELDTRQLAPGPYHVRIATGKALYVRLVVKE
jgi:hypothetical protein